MEFNVRLKGQTKLKVNTNLGGVQVPAKFSDLEDYDGTNVNDSYIIMYNASTGKYRAVNPDEVLRKAVTDPIQSGLPSEFIDKLDVDLDDKIDLDAGTF